MLERTEFTDRFGVDIYIGDLVIAAKSEGRTAILNIGIVERATDTRLYYNTHCDCGSFWCTSNRWTVGNHDNDLKELVKLRSNSSEFDIKDMREHGLEGLLRGL